MKLTAEIDGESRALELRREGARVFAEVGGRAYELEARETEARPFLLSLDGRVYECRVEAGDGLVVVEAMKMQNELKSPKAGTVVELRARAGATVNAGDVLVVVE